MTQLKKIFKQGLIITLIALVVGVVVLQVDGGQVLAAGKDEICAGVGAIDPSGSCDGSSESTINSLIATIINLLSIAVGVISVIMVIVGGFKYVASNGDQAGVTSAKNTIMYAVVGLVVVALAQVIVNFVLSEIK